MWDIDRFVEVRCNDQVEGSELDRQICDENIERQGSRMVGFEGKREQSLEVQCAANGGPGDIGIRMQSAIHPRRVAVGG